MLRFQRYAHATSPILDLGVEFGALVRPLYQIITERDLAGFEEEDGGGTSELLTT
ncbi:MAG: hypothetical protein ACI8T1_005028 [Verrucomicrobiales bacterium]|jgi:hypothetical protein